MSSCPQCRQGSLHYSRLDESLLCQTCDYCGGYCIQLTDYLRWQARETSLPDSDLEARIDAEDSKQ